MPNLNDVAPKTLAHKPVNGSTNAQNVACRLPMTYWPSVIAFKLLSGNAFKNAPRCCAAASSYEVSNSASNTRSSCKLSGEAMVGGSSKTVKPSLAFWQTILAEYRHHRTSQD